MKFLPKSRDSVLKTFTKTVADLLAVADAEECKAYNNREKAVRLRSKAVAADERFYERFREAKKCRLAAAQIEKLLPSSTENA